MTELTRKIGQLIIGKVPGTELDQASSNALSNGIMGGITLFKENASDLSQLIELVASIRQHLGPKALISVDQEGGAIQRFDHLITPTPSAMAQAALDDLEQVSAIAEIMARQLQLLGINCMLSPVLDICCNPLNPVISTRSYSSDPFKVKSWGLAVEESLKQVGILGVGKHFPGHGATLEDSHTGLASNDANAELLWQREMIPFKAYCSSGRSVMMGHIWMKSIDSEPLPASLSSKVTSGVLRDYLKYDGLVMTDDLMMKAITERWTPGEAAVMSVLAGCDQVMICGSTEDIQEAHEALLKATVDGRLSEQRLNQSLDRLDKVLAGLTACEMQSKSVLTKNLKALNNGFAIDRAKAFSASLASICLLRGEVPPIVAGDWVVVLPDHPRYKIDLANLLQAQIDHADNKITLIEKRYSLDPSQGECDQIAQFCTGKNCIYVTFKTLNNKGQIQLGRTLADHAIPQLNLSVDIPYDLIGLPNWNNCLASFDPSDLAMEAAAQVISGAKPANGTCPVNMQIAF